MPDIENPFFSELAKAIEKEAYEQEYRILLCNSDDQKEKELANLQMLAQLQADGVILMTNTGEKSQSYEAVSMPIVFVDRRLDEMGQTSVIEADHYAGGKTGGGASDCMWMQKDYMYSRAPRIVQRQEAIRGIPGSMSSV